MAKRRVRRSASEWAEHVGDWRASGLTQRVFARQRGLSASTLAAWARRIGEVRGLARRSSAAQFSEVRVLPAPVPQRPGVMEVTTPGGYLIRVTATVDPAALRAVLEEVSRC